MSQPEGAVTAVELDNGASRASNAHHKPFLKIMGWSSPFVLATVSFLLLNRTVSHVWLISLPGLLTIAFALTSAITDSLWRKIPNWLTYPACLTGLVASSAVTWGGASDFWGELGLWESVQGMLTCFACMIFAYRASGGGAGDVKLATAYGALLGWQQGLSIIILAYMIAGLMLLFMQLASEHPWMLPAVLVRWIGSSLLPQWVQSPSESQQKLLARPVPLGGAFAIGFLAVLNGFNVFGR